MAPRQEAYLHVLVTVSALRKSVFKEKMHRLTAQLREQQAEAAKLDKAIAANLKELGYGG